jgi:hypothetical protein
MDVHRIRIPIAVLVCCAVVALCGVTGVFTVQQGVLQPPVGRVQLGPFILQTVITDCPACAPLPGGLLAVSPGGPDYYVFWVLTVKEERGGVCTSARRVFALQMQ